MDILVIIAVVAVLLAVLLGGAYLCYRMAFHVTEKQKRENAARELPPGKEYEPFYPQMNRWAEERRALTYQEFTVTSFDGLKLRAKYYECNPGAPVELMFHGYRGTAERDLGGGIQRCFSLGWNVFIVDQRTACGSEGKTITFGVNESRDCLTWVDFMVEHFGPEVKIVLTGISMGASTVLMAAGRALPPNVVGVLADCGYSTAQGIIKKVIRQMKLPADLLYPLVRLGADLYGQFNLEEDSPLAAMKRCRLPVIFFHGEEDDFVPCDMSRQLYEACTSPRKALITIPGACHGAAYLVDGDRYLRELAAFWESCGLPVAQNRR